MWYVQQQVASVIIRGIILLSMDVWLSATDILSTIDPKFITYNVGFHWLSIISGPAISYGDKSNKCQDIVFLTWTDETTEEVYGINQKGNIVQE